MLSTTYIFAEPSGSGKTSLVRGLYGNIAGLTAAMTVTTSEPRIGEIRNEDRTLKFRPCLVLRLVPAPRTKTLLLQEGASVEQPAAYWLPFFPRGFRSFCP